MYTDYVIIKKLKDIIDTDRDVAWGSGKSRRLLLESDGLPFTLTETTVRAGTISKMHYPKHVEACLCLEGEADLEANGVVYKIEPGTLYVPQHDQHILKAYTDMRFICVFTPPLKGKESHKLSAEGFSAY